MDHKATENLDEELHIKDVLAEIRPIAVRLNSPIVINTNNNRADQEYKIVRMDPHEKRPRTIWKTDET